LVPFGENVFPLAADERQNVFAAAGHYGKVFKSLLKSFI